MVEPSVADSARKHGIGEEDLLHAFRNPIRVFEMDEGVTLFTGLSSTGADQ